ncbi:MAG: hypothetical protein GC136_05030 [Alphaproteobacteria bacterium]|nr:hypothetical protein [Alphaproteobacteria bacterium]
MIELEFKQRPIDVPSDLRLYRRLSMLCVSLSVCCRGGSASFKQLHFLNALMIDSKFYNLYTGFKKHKFTLKILCPSADPYLNRCVNYALGAGLVNQKKVQNSFKIELSDRGKDFVDSLKNEDLALDIFDLCKSIGKISDKEVNTLLKTED